MDVVWVVLGQGEDYYEYWMVWLFYVLVYFLCCGEYLCVVVFLGFQVQVVDVVELFEVVVVIGVVVVDEVVGGGIDCYCEVVQLLQLQWQCVVYVWCQYVGCVYVVGVEDVLWQVGD